jgi:uncharacterized repeat protein (TIGR03803 family)
MRNLSWCKKAGAVLAIWAAATVVARGQTFKSLASFNLTNGGGPAAPVAQGQDGELYGTTNNGGTDPNDGTVFKVSSGGTITSLYSFAPNSDPNAGLSLANDGDFYGMTPNGGDGKCEDGCGQVFKIGPKGAETTLYSFTVCPQAKCAGGIHPAYGGLVQGTDGSFYGTTTGGGPRNAGTVFEITPKGTLTTLHSFQFTDGYVPESTLTQAADGNFYGTTGAGGNLSCDPPGGCGTIFKITPDGAFTSLHSFSQADGSSPTGLIQASDGNLYGVTEAGGSAGDEGTVFRATLQGAVTTLYSFSSFDGMYPFGTLVQATDGNLYGTTMEGGTGGVLAGTIFRITLSGTLTTLYNFCSRTNCTDGSLPVAGLMQSTNGLLYGTTDEGGSYGHGTIFNLDAGLGPFVTFVRPFGKVGAIGGILGQGFTGTTSVDVNGVPANFTVVSDTYLTATVPPGATTGYVTVTTPTGVLTSNVPFHVIK